MPFSNKIAYSASSSSRTSYEAYCRQYIGREDGKSLAEVLGLWDEIWCGPSRSIERLLTHPHTTRILGDLVYFQGFGKSLLVLNSLQAMTDLFEKRASKYSHRPNIIFGRELIGMGQVTFGPPC